MSDNAPAFVLTFLGASVALLGIAAAGSVPVAAVGLLGVFAAGLIRSQDRQVAAR